MKDTQLPPDVRVRQHSLSETVGEHRHVVLLSRPPREPTPPAFADALGATGGMAIYMTYGAGTRRLDDDSVALVRGTLDAGGVAWLGFARGDDAAECARSLRGRRQ